MTAVHLRRIDATRNLRRFYRLDVQSDLFGGVLLVKKWGRIGARGRIVAERYDDEVLAATAMQRQAERKRRRGYVAQIAICSTSSPAERMIGGTTCPGP
jgi:predicted DNA-binding WGR domain protein